MYDELKKQFGNTLVFSEPIGKYTTYHIGGPADIFFPANSYTELVAILTSIEKLGIPYIVLGGGSNIVVSDAGIRGLVIKNNTSEIVVRGMKGNIKQGSEESTVYVEADSGVLMNKLVRFTIEEGLIGLEMHLGLPGSVGGAVYMNSKWTKPMGSIGDAVKQAEIFHYPDGVVTVDAEYFRFRYGESSLQKNHDVLLRATFALKKANKDAVWSRANESISYRRQTQPQGDHTAGCVFKNISQADAVTHAIPERQTSAGWLLDRAGCKGMRAGGAYVSQVHANFIMTQAGATSADVLELIQEMKEAVRKMFGVLLKEEIIMVGDFSYGKVCR